MNGGFLLRPKARVLWLSSVYIRNAFWDGRHGSDGRFARARSSSKVRSRDLLTRACSVEVGRCHFSSVGVSAAGGWRSIISTRPTLATTNSPSEAGVIHEGGGRSNVTGPVRQRSQIE